MIIEYDKYILRPEAAAKDKFTLYKKICTKSKPIEKVLGRGFTLSAAFRIIISHELYDNEKVVTLKQYIEEYRKLKDEIIPKL